MATFKPVLFKTKNHIKQDGTTNIKIRIYHNKESQYVSTDYYIEPEYMLSDGTISPVHPHSSLYNYEIGEIVQTYRKAALKLGTSRTMNMSCAELRDYIVDSIKPTYDYIDFVSFCSKIIKAEKKEKTAEWYQQSLNSFVWFIGKDKFDARDVTRNKIKAWIERLKESGKSGKPLRNGTISNYVRGLRALYNLCKDEYNEPDHDIIRIPNEPFLIDDIPVYRRERKNIQIEIIKMIRDFDAKFKREQMSRDVFMMMFYMMGINVGDLYRLNDPVRGRVNYDRSKTRTGNSSAFTLSIKVEPELQALFDKYSDDGFLSRIKRYSTIRNFTKAVNKGLEGICEKLEIQKVTSNWARHSWASIARNKAKIPKADVDFCLGHVNNDYKMADIYIDIDYSICDDANRKVLDLLK